MPILGILASAITGNLVTTAYESIQTVTVGGGGAANIQFTSIPATYTHLQIRIFNLVSSSPINLNMKFNSATTNYNNHTVYGDGSSAGAAAGMSTSAIVAGVTSYTSAPGTNIIDILDYTNTNKYKTTRTLTGSDNNGAGFVALYSGLWMSTSAITQIDLTPNSGTFQQYTSAALYGIKGA
jgi:hypothetical protein